MPKKQPNISSIDTPSDRLTTTEVSQILGVHRNTLQRMASSLLLPPDGKSGGGRSYWLRSSVEAYRLGTLTAATVWHISESPIKELNLVLQSGYRILGQSTASVPLAGNSRTEFLARLLSFIAEMKLHALALPSSTADTSTHTVVRDACHESGIPVILYPA